MQQDHILLLNLPKVLRCLGSILPASPLVLIKKQISLNVSGLMDLARIHLRSATNATGYGAWRQKVSRSYYACYIATRAIRLAVYRVYSQESKDHKAIGNLPKAFPSCDKWRDFLTKFQADRCLADYDHTARVADLEMPAGTYVTRAKDFIQQTRTYLMSKGLL